MPNHEWYNVLCVKTMFDKSSFQRWTWLSRNKTSTHTSLDLYPPERIKVCLLFSSISFLRTFQVFLHGQYHSTESNPTYCCIVLIDWLDRLPCSISEKRIYIRKTRAGQDIAVAPCAWFIVSSFHIRLHWLEFLSALPSSKDRRLGLT